MTFGIKYFTIQSDKRSKVIHENNGRKEILKKSIS